MGSTVLPFAVGDFLHHSRICEIFSASKYFTNAFLLLLKAPRSNINDDIYGTGVKIF